MKLIRLLSSIVLLYQQKRIMRKYFSNTWFSLRKDWLIPCVASLALSGCSQVYLSQADRAYQNLAYQRAVDLYEQGLKSNKNPKAQLCLADAYRQLNQTKQAELAYRTAIESSAATDQDHLNFAKVLLTNGKYQEAANWVRKFLEVHPKDEMAKQLYITCYDFESFKTDDSTLIRIDRINLNGFQSAYAPALRNQELVFTSQGNSSLGLKKDPWTGEQFVNLYAGEFNEKGEISQAKPLVGEINKLFHEGAACFSADGNTVYFTRSNFSKNKLRKNQQDVSNLKLYIAQWINDQWMNVKELPFNSEDYSVGHPAISKDGKMLVFISDMPGGFGGTDLYSVMVTDSGYSKPVNLGPSINTQGHEMFPSWGYAASELYFSTDGRAGLGGLDLFKTSLQNNAFSTPRNMGYPFNTEKDDFSFVEIQGGRSGFLCSNRADVDQLYHFQLVDPRYTLTGRVFDMKTNLPIDSVAVAVLDLTDGSAYEIYTDRNGVYQTELKKDHEYKLIAEKTAYFASQKQANTLYRKYSAQIQVDFLLDPIILNKPIVLDNIYYDLAKWDIRSDAVKELDKLVSLLKENPGIYIELSSHTDARSSDSYNLKLSQKRASSAVSYLISNGIDAKRLTAKGYGETRLLNQCGNKSKCSEADHQKNRRTEFKVLKIENTGTVLSRRR